MNVVDVVDQLRAMFSRVERIEDAAALVCEYSRLDPDGRVLCFYKKRVIECAAERCPLNINIVEAQYKYA